MKAHVALKLVLTALLLAPFGCGGNGCSKGKVIVNEPMITFTYPLDADQVVPTQDVNTSAPGIQVNVAAKVENIKAGESLYLWNDIDTVQRRIEGTVQGSQVVFPGYTLPVGRVNLRIAVPAWDDSMGCDGQRCAQVTIQVIAAACTYNDPHDGDPLTIDQYPEPSDPLDPFETDVKLGCMGMDAGDSRNHVELRVSGGRVLTGLPDAGGNVIFPRVALAEGANVLAAIPFVVTTTGPTDPPTPGATATATVTVDTGRCLAALEPIDGAHVLAEDDYDFEPSNGMQATLNLYTDCDLTSAVTLHYRKRTATDPQPAFTTLDLTAHPPVPTVSDRGNRFNMVSVQLDESAGPDLYDIELIGEVEETAGQKGLTVPTRYWVDSIPPTLVSYSPGVGACVGAPQDLYPDNATCDGYADSATCVADSACRWEGGGTSGKCVALDEIIQIDAFGLVAGAETGAEVWLTTSTVAAPLKACTPETEATDCTAPQLCRNLVCRGVGKVTAGNFVIRQVPVPPGTVTFEYVATDLAGNPSQPGTAQVEVFDHAPAVAITAPAVVSPATSVNLGVNDDLDKNTPGLQYAVQISVANVPAGTLGTLLTGARTYSFIPPTGATGTVTRQVALEDGTHTLTARVQDPCGNSIDSAPVVVNVFASPAVVGVTAYAADNSICATYATKTLCEGASAVVACMWNDTATTPSCVAGFTGRHKLDDGALVRGDTVDVDVVTGLGIEAHPHVVTVDLYPSSTGTGANRECDGTAVAGPTASVAETATGVLFTDIDLLTGINCVQVSVDDGINASTSNLILDATGNMPGLTITAPTAGTVSADSSSSLAGFNYTLVATLGAAHAIDGIMEVRAGNGPNTFGVFRAPVAAGDAIATFTDASLPYGAVDLVAVFTDMNGERVESPVVSVTVGAVTPAIAIVSPRTGSELEPAATPIDILVAPVGSGSLSLTCTLFVDDASTATTATDTATATDPLTLTHTFAAGTHDVRVECGSGVSQTITIGVAGATPPVPQLRSEDPGVAGRLVFTNGSYLNGRVADVSGVAGVQHPIGVVVGTNAADPTGWTVDLFVVPPGASVPTVYSSVIGSGGDPVLVTFGSVFLTAADSGSVKLWACVTDAAAEVRCGAPVTLTVDRLPPILTQTYPPPSQTLLTMIDSTLNPPGYVDFAFTYEVTGDAVGDVRLSVSPPPHGMTAADFPLSEPTAATVGFAVLPYDDGLYAASATVSDAAGNVATAPLYSFEVRGLAAQITWGIPRAPGYIGNAMDTVLGQAGIQIQFVFGGAGFVGGTTLKICSTTGTPGAIGTCAAGDELSCCRWRSDGTKRTDFAAVDPDAGYVIGTTPLSGTPSGTTGFLAGVSLADGTQTIHAEAVDPSQTPDGYSPFWLFTVDSVPPEVTAVAFADNDTPNDVAGAGGYIVLNPTEGTAGSRGLKTTLSVTATGSAPGIVFDVVSDVPSAGTVVSLGVTDCTSVAQCQSGQSCVDRPSGSGKECRWLLGGSAGTQTGSIIVDIAQGRQTLSVRVWDEAGNPNDLATNTAANASVVVDLTPPTVMLPGPAYGSAPYTSKDGTIDTKSTPTTADDTLAVPISVAVQDNVSLAGAKLTVRSFAALTGGTAQDTRTVDLVDGQVTVDIADFPLHMGKNFVEALLVDAAGNQRLTTPRIIYPADFYGPDLTLVVWTGRSVGTPAAQTCATDTTACLADYVDPAAHGGLAKLDTVGTDTYATSPTTGGTDLRFSLAGSVNSDASLETGDSTVWLESYMVGGALTYLPVFMSSHGESGDVAADTSYDTRAGAANYALDPGAKRAVRVAAMDSNGNISHSQPVFLQLNLNGFLVSVTRLNAAMAPVGLELTDGAFWGPAENLSGSGFATNLRVTVTKVGGTANPTDVDLTVNGASALNTTLTGGTTGDFAGVVFVTSPDPAHRAAGQQNTLTIAVNCDTGDDCGSKQYTGIIADIDPPSFQFDRCSLCALEVPLVSATVCGTCAAAAWDGNSQANVKGVGDPAIWNAAKDQDANPGNGFSISSTGTPLVVKVTGLEGGEHVRLTSDRGSLTGNDVLSATDTATFGSLNLPSLGAPNKVHKLQVSFTDRAGNTATVDVGRGTDNDAIYAKTDVVAPGAALPTVCIGESTTPYTISSPASDPTTYEDPGCTAACAASSACSRRGGKATLVWQAPYDDGSTGGKVVSYEIRVAARGIPYPQPFVSGTSAAVTQCSELDANDATKVEQVITMSATAMPGGQEAKTVTDLYPHRSYCFAVLGVDDVGNKAVVATSVKERAMPLVNYPKTVAFDALSPNDGNVAGALHVDTDSGLFFGCIMTALGDIDGDSKEDFAVARANFSATTPPTTVSVFLSRSTLAAPAVVIEAPAVAAPGGDGFGTAMAAGDFDNDGYSDLAICANDHATLAGPYPGASGGALFLYYGSPTGIRRDANAVDDTLPSIYPDVALLGPAGTNFCYKVLLAEVNGTSGSDLIVGTGNWGPGPNRVYGFFGGSRSRFPGAPPATTKIYLDLSSGAGGGFSNRPDFSISGRADGNAVQFPQSLTAADVDGDGVMDLSVSDHQANHATGVCLGCGEVYIYRGGVGLSGVLAAPDTDPPQLITTLRYLPGIGNFGQNMLAVPHPKAPADMADWLLVHSGIGDRVTVFQATSTGAKPGIVPEVFPPGGLSPTSYIDLDSTTWDGQAAASFGWSLSLAGDLGGSGRPSILAGPGIQFAALPSFLYAFNPAGSEFEKRVVFVGGQDFGAAAIGVANYLGTPGAVPESQVVISETSADAIFIFR